MYYFVSLQEYKIIHPEYTCVQYYARVVRIHQHSIFSPYCRFHSIFSPLHFYTFHSSRDDYVHFNLDNLDKYVQ